MSIIIIIIIRHKYSFQSVSLFLSLLFYAQEMLKILPLLLALKK